MTFVKCCLNLKPKPVVSETPYVTRFYFQVRNGPLQNAPNLQKYVTDKDNVEYAHADNNIESVSTESYIFTRGILRFVPISVSAPP